MEPTTIVEFTVYGIPQPQGSARAFTPKGWKRPVITTANSTLKPWRQQVAGTAVAAMNERNLAQVARPEAVLVEMAFFFDKPKSARKKDVHKTTKPDYDKLARALSDAITGIVIEDDAQIVDAVIHKRFGSPARTEVSVRRIE